MIYAMQCLIIVNTFLETSADRQKSVDKNLLFHLHIPKFCLRQENEMQVGRLDLADHINGKVCGALRYLNLLA